MKLAHKHMINCRLMPDRYVMLKWLPKNAVVAEVGVLGGDFSKFIINRCKPEKLHLIDTFKSNDWEHSKRFKTKNHFSFIKEEFSKEINDKKVELHKGISWKLLSNFEDNYFDWIYIDADHTYESVKKDLKIAHQKVKENGLLVLNDYILYDHIADDEYGVIQAVNEFCIENNWEIIYFALHPQMFCDVAIKKIENK